MAQGPFDELVSWSLDQRGGVTGFTGIRASYRFNWLSRLLLPAIDPDFAKPGDLLEVIPIPSFVGDIGIVANYTQRRVLTADPMRCLLLVALVFALPLPLLFMGDTWRLLIVSGIAAAALHDRLFNSGAASPRVVAEESADWNIAAWRLIRARHTGVPPGYEFVDEPEPEWVPLLDRAYAGQLEDHEAVEIGTLPIPDGKLLACEPFQIHEPRPHTIAVQPGDYPVFISIAASPKSPDQRIAYAWVRLRDGKPARWELARTRAGKDVSVGVDSGIAGFTSAAAAKSLVDTYRKQGGDYREPLNDAVQKAMSSVWRDTRGWAMLDAEGPLRLAAFSSGFGDGIYPVYQALDARRRRLAIAMVFSVNW